MMVKLIYGRRSPYFEFNDNADFFECYGFICNMERHNIEIVWEYNNVSGAWANEGRIHFLEQYDREAYSPMPATIENRLTIGRGNIAARLNCNEYIIELKNFYGFATRTNGNGITPQRLYPPTNPEQYVPQEYLEDFYRGYNM